MDQAMPVRPIVIVEDDESLLAAMTFDLQTDGYVVFAYADGEDLLSAAPIRNVGCFVIDLRLPGSDGLTVLGRLRSRGETAPAILITTNPEARHREAARAASAIIVEKPLLGGELRRRIDEALAV